MKVVSGPRCDPTWQLHAARSDSDGLQVHNVEMQPGRGGQIARSPSSTCQLMARDGGSAVLVMPSGEMRKIGARCRATIGAMGIDNSQNVRWGKAGRVRYMGWRPHGPVRHLPESRVPPNGWWSNGWWSSPVFADGQALQGCEDAPRQGPQQLLHPSSSSAGQAHGRW